MQTEDVFYSSFVLFARDIFLTMLFATMLSFTWLTRAKRATQKEHCDRILSITLSGQSERTLHIETRLKPQREYTQRQHCAVDTCIVYRQFPIHKIGTMKLALLVTHHHAFVLRVIANVNTIS